MEAVKYNIGAFILEDDIDMHEIMRQTLEQNDVIVEITPDPDIFRAKLRTADISMIVLDHHLDGKITGLSLLKEAKEVNKWIYAIIMSGQPDMNVVIDYLNEGANKYINKNWTEDQLHERLEGCPLKYPDPTYLNVLVKFVKEGLDKSNKRVGIFKQIEKTLR